MSGDPEKFRMSIEAEGLATVTGALTGLAAEAIDYAFIKKPKVDKANDHISHLQSQEATILTMQDDIPATASQAYRQANQLFIAREAGHKQSEINTALANRPHINTVQELGTFAGAGVSGAVTFLALACTIRLRLNHQVATARKRKRTREIEDTVSLEVESGLNDLEQYVNNQRS